MPASAANVFVLMRAALLNLPQGPTSGPQVRANRPGGHPAHATFSWDSARMKELKAHSSNHDAAPWHDKTQATTIPAARYSSRDGVNAWAAASSTCNRRTVGASGTGGSDHAAPTNQMQ